MLWFILSLLTAFFKSTTDLFSKKGLKKVDAYIAAWSLASFALIFLLPLLFFVSIPTFGPLFWHALLISGSLSVLTSILYMKAIKASPLSLTIPMETFTPLFLLLTSPIILGEFPTPFGLVGILLIVFGAYMLNIKEMRVGLLAPFKSLLKEKGPVVMLCTAFIWSITANIGKIGILNSSPVLWMIVVHLFISMALFLIISVKSRRSLNQIPTNLKALIPIGLFNGLNLIFYAFAITLTIVPYVISIKRTSVIFSTLYGYFIFREKGIRERLLGAIIMIVGVLFITLF